MKNIIIGLTLLIFSFSANAQEKKNKNAKYDIEVNGNCDMCKKRIEKAAFSVSGVKTAEWHSDDQTLHVIINEQKNSISAVKKAVAQVGHDTDEIKAADEQFEKLHECCMYERK